VFKLDDDDVMYLAIDDVDDGQRTGVLTAVENCPRQALSVIE
jgi:ferredoxin